MSDESKPSLPSLDLDGDGRISRNETIIVIAIIFAALLAGAGTLYAVGSGHVSAETLQSVVLAVVGTAYTGSKALKR